VIRKMVRDLNLDVEIVVCPIVRENDGLAMSSRNAYLNPEQRKQALVLSRALQQVEKRVAQGETSAQRLIAVGKQIMAEQPSVRLDYFEIVNPDTLDAVADVGQGALVAVAAYVGTTRLIDNLLLSARE
jgi:pantoate--beta-alanine ligase